MPIICQSPIDSSKNNTPESAEIKVEKDVKKRVMRGGFSTIMVALVVAIVIVLNIVAPMYANITNDSEKTSAEQKER